MNQSTENMPTFFRFEDLRIYHKALDYVKWVQDISSLMPDIDHTGFKLAFNQSSREIAFNIAEGSARNKAQFVYHLKIAKSAIRQCLVFTTLAHNNHYITDEQEDDGRNQLMEMTKMLGALITSLQKAAGITDQYDDDRQHTKPY
jgi:four helix bundle protein